MKKLDNLLKNNQEWAARIRRQEPTFFSDLVKQQAPKYFWIGCSDSRVPANQIVGLLPGDLFVHRNVANVVVHTDLNCLSASQFAVDALKVEHIIVTGHYGCGGVLAALRGDRLGLVDNWIRHVGDVRKRHEQFLERLPDEETRWRRLCELNVIEQVSNLCQTTVVQDAWSRGQVLSLHGLVYGIEDGILRDLDGVVSNASEVRASYENAVRRVYSSAPA